MSAIPRSLIFLFVLYAAAEAQTTDSISREVGKITYTTGISPVLLETSGEHEVDTTLNTVHFFDPVDQAGFTIRNNGNLGMAHFQLVCCPQPENGLNIGYNQFAIYRFIKSEVRFYKNAHPYTRLNMNIGQRKEQIFEVEHSQNIRKKFNFGFHYKRFASNGAYQRQEARHNALAFTTTFDSKKRYLLKTELIFNNNRAEENGGIKETNIFKDTSFVTKELVDIELPEAENRRRDIYFHTQQSWKFGSFVAAMDTGMAGKTGYSRPEWLLFHDIDVGREKYEFNDLQPDSAYYGLFYHDDSVTQDFHSRAQNRFLGSRLGVRKYFRNSMTLEFSANYAVNLLDQDGYSESHLQNLDASIAFLKDTSGKVSFGGSAAYSFLDYRKDDWRAKAFIGYDFGKAGEVVADISYTRVQPPWLFNRFSFEEISWDNAFGKQADFSAGISYRLPKYNVHVSAVMHNIDGLAYWDENRLPSQSDAWLQVWVLEARKLFRIRYFGFDNLIRVQIVSEKALLRFPVYWGVHSLFYERGVFKGKLLTRVGLDIRYNTNYQAYGYFPLTGQFHLQDNETLKFYPVMDVYVSFRIQTVRLFFIFNHVNQGAFRDRGYFNAYKYPADERHFRFGLSWMFLD